MIKWSILIASVPARREIRSRLLGQIEEQITDYDDIEVLVLEDNRKRLYGEKLQALIDVAQGEYLSFLDDDDEIDPTYIESIYPLLDGTDAVGFRTRVMYDDGSEGETEYSLKHTEWVNGQLDLRPHQQLSVIRSELVRQVPWVGGSGADRVWAMAMTKANLVKTEHLIPRKLYTYHYTVDPAHRKDVWD